MFNEGNSREIDSSTYLQYAFCIHLSQLVNVSGALFTSLIMSLMMGEWWVRLVGSWVLGMNSLKRKVLEEI